ncbi:hypothetical protein D3C86_762150 [compost metagenome]
MGTGHAVAAVTLHVVDVVADTAKLRQARQGQEEVAGPGVLHLDVRQLGEGLLHLGDDQPLYVCRIPRPIDNAAAVEQPVIPCGPVVVEQVVAIFQAVVLRQQGAGPLLPQHLGGDDLRAARHALARQLRHQVAEIGVAGHHHEARLHRPLGRLHQGNLARSDAGDGGLLEDATTQGADGFRLPQRQVEGVDMAAALVQQGADVAIACHHLAHPFGIEQLQLIVAPLLPAGMLCLEFVELLLRLGGKDPPLLQIALDVVALDPLADDVSPLKQHGAEQPGLIRRAVRFYGVDVTAVGVDYLAAVAAAGAKPHPGRLQHHHLVALLHQVQGAGEAGIPGPYDADVALKLLGEHRVGGVLVGTGCVVTLYMFGHDPCFLTGSFPIFALFNVKSWRGCGR